MPNHFGYHRLIRPVYDEYNVLHRSEKYFASQNIQIGSKVLDCHQSFGPMHRTTTQVRMDFFTSQVDLCN